jgi:hypothetical protein
LQGQRGQVAHRVAEQYGLQAVVVLGKWRVEEASASLQRGRQRRSADERHGRLHSTSWNIQEHS